MKQRRPGHAERWVQVRNVPNFVGKLEGKRPFGDPGVDDRANVKLSP
jgi:hypothetical protein